MRISKMITFKKHVKIILQFLVLQRALQQFVIALFLLVFSEAVEAQTTLDLPQYESIVELGHFHSANHVVIEQKQIQASPASTLSQLLSTQANISVTGNSGQLGSIYLRGGDSGHVLILLDGLPYYDPASIQRSVNLDTIDIHSIKRIEIIKGAQSVLYGGQALAGVIKIETLPQDMLEHQYVQVEVGQRLYTQLSAGLQIALEDQILTTRVQNKHKADRSPVLDSGYVYDQNTATVEQSYLLKKDFDFFLKGLYIQNVQDLSSSDYSNYKVIDARDYSSRSNQLNIGGGLIGKHMQSKPQLLVGYQLTDRGYDQPRIIDEKYVSSSLSIRNQYQLLDEQDFQSLIGLDYNHENFKYQSFAKDVTDSQGEQKGLFAQAQMRISKKTLFEAGLRSEIMQEKDRVETYQLGLTLWDQLKFQWATGFKAPSLYQLYSSYGNTQLLPEKSQSYSASWNHDFIFSEWSRWQNSISLALFHSSYDNLISTKSIGSNLRYENVSRSQTRGLELALSTTDQNWTYTADFGYQEPKDIEKNRWLLRRPLQTATLQVLKNSGAHTYQFETVYSGERIDSFSSTETGSLDSYAVSNLGYNYQHTKELELYIKAKNIFNNRFEQTRGYYDEGLFVLTGLIWEI